MVRAVLLLALAALVVPAVAGAHEGHHDGKAAAAESAMIAEMMKCSICKNFAAHWTELGPVMKGEAVKLSDGMAMVSAITEPSKVALYHSTYDAMGKAGEACMTMTDEQASKELCSWCQDIRGAMKAGAHMSMGKTSDGSIFVLTSTDPAVQTRLASLYTKCAMMHGQATAN